MFNFLHPKPVVSRRPVAEHAIKQSARRTALPEVLIVKAPQRELPALAAAAAGAGAIEFSVVYRRREYLSFVQAHVRTRIGTDPSLRAERRHWEDGLPTLSLMERCVIGAIGSLMFAYKRRLMPRCDFRIDAQGIRRQSARGGLHLIWDEVQAVHRYPAGYLITISKGVMPLPRRCMTTNQHAKLAQWLQDWERLPTG